MPLGYFVNLPVEYFLTEYQFSQKVTWIKGSHAVKAGVTIAKTFWNQPFPNSSRGTATASGAWTSYSVADFDLGLLNASTIQRNNTRTYPRFAAYGLFLTDDYKITRSLTLNMSLRYEINEPMHDKYDRMLNFVPELNKIVIASAARTLGLSTPRAKPRSTSSRLARPHPGFLEIHRWAWASRTSSHSRAHVTQTRE